LAKERSRIFSEQIAMGESTQDELRKEAELKAEVSAIEERVLHSMKEINNQKNVLQQKITAEHKAEIDKRKKADEDAEKSRVKALADRAKAELLEIETRYDKEILAAEGNKEEIERIEEEKKEAIIEKTKETLQATLQELEGSLLTASADDGILADMIMSDEDRAALELRIAQIRKELAGLDVELSSLGSEEGEEPKTLADIMGLTDEDVEKINAKVEGISAGIALVSDLVNANADFRIAKLEEEKAIALQSAGDSAEKRAEIEAVYNKKIEAENKKAAKKNQKISILMAIVETAKAVVAGFNAGMSTGGPAAPILAGVYAALAAATGAIQIATIKKQKFATGGMITGPSHSQGGVPFTVGGHAGFEAEGGEYIINKNAVDALGTPYLDSINSIGRPTRTGTHGHFASGGRVNTPTISIPPGVQQTSAVIQQSNADLVEALDGRIDRLQVMVSESDISSTQAKVADVEETVSFG